MEFECSFEGAVREVQGWADSQDAARGSSAVGAFAKAALVLAGFDPSAVCRFDLAFGGEAVSLRFDVSDVSVSTAGFPQSQTTEDHAAAIDQGQAGVVVSDG